MFQRFLHKSGISYCIFFVSALVVRYLLLSITAISTRYEPSLFHDERSLSTDSYCFLRKILRLDLQNQQDLMDKVEIALTFDRVTTQKID